PNSKTNKNTGQNWSTYSFTITKLRNSPSSEKLLPFILVFFGRFAVTLHVETIYIYRLLYARHP
uniref:hypothetical protein n=1 Tax=Alloprevotella sp. TaxID=1872471 RepID=UPI004028AC65